MRQTFFVWDDVVARPAWQQMAIDRALADRAGRDGTIVARLYRWQGHSVSFGANESARRTWDRERLEDHGINCVRRPTGGRGVWHDATDLTYAFTAPLAAFGDLRTAYRVIHEQLARALEGPDLVASLAPASGRPTLSPGACFDVAVGGEVLINGRKTVGSAQAVFGSELLQHGAIARADRSGTLARFRLETPGVNPDISPAPLLQPEALAARIVGTWHAEGGVPATGELTEWAIDESGEYADRYGDPAWTWRR